jgi:hypothetical protein
MFIFSSSSIPQWVIAASVIWKGIQDQAPPMHYALRMATLSRLISQ